MKALEYRGKWKLHLGQELVKAHNKETTNGQKATEY